MKKWIIILIVGLGIEISACKTAINVAAPSAPIAADEHLGDIQLSGAGKFTTLISFRAKGNSGTNLRLLDSTVQYGLNFSFKKTIKDGKHQVIRIQGDSTFSAFYKIEDNSIAREAGSVQIKGKSTNGKNSLFDFQYPNDAL